MMTESTPFEHQPLSPKLIKARLKARGLKQQNLADFLGWDLHVVNRLLNNKRKLQYDEAARIEAFFDEADPDDAEGGRIARISDYTPAAPGAGEVPLYGAGPDGELRLDDRGRIGLTRSHPMQAGAKRGFAVQAVDDRNAPRYELGEVVYVIRGMAARRGTDCVVEMRDGSAWLGRYADQTSSAVILTFAGDKAQKALSRSEVRAIHAVVGRG